MQQQVQAQAICFGSRVIKKRFHASLCLLCKTVYIIQPGVKHVLKLTTDVNNKKSEMVYGKQKTQEETQTKNEQMLLA